MANLGALVVSLEANIAKFTSDMGRAAQQTEQAMAKINGAVNMAKGALAALGIGVTVGEFAALVKGSIDAADNLRDMSQKTGIAVETLNGLAFAAGQAGGSLETMVAAAGKANKTIVEAAGGNKDAIEGFSKLGISVRDASGNLKSADVIIAEVADKFKGYADGPEKAAIAVRIFGKAGADMIPVLNDGGDSMRENIEYAKKYSGVTQELADASDNFNDSLGKLAIQQKGFGNAMATELLPLLQIVTNEILGASEQSNKFSLATNVIRTSLETLVVTGSEVVFTFKSIGNTLGAVMALNNAMLHGDLEQMRAIRALAKQDASQARTDHDKFIADVLDRTPKAVTAEGVPAAFSDPPAPMLRAKGDDPTKALLDNRLKGIEAAYQSERDVSVFHNQFMDSLRGQGIVDLQAYEDFKKASIETGLAASIRAYDSEIAALEKYRAAAGKETDRAEADGKIKDKLALKEKARVDASQARAMLDLNNAQVRKGLVDKWQAESDASNAQDESNFLSIRQSLLTVTQAENESYAKRLDGLVRWKDAQVANEELGNEAIEAEKKRHAQALADIQIANDMQAYAMASDAAGQLYNILKNAGNEKTALAKSLFLAQKAIAVAEILINTEKGAAVALGFGPFGIPMSALIRGLGYASAGIVAGTAIAEASAQGGYDIPAGKNPVTQLHEKEMVLPRAQADVIRNLAGSGGGGSAMKVTIINQTTGRIDSVVEQRISPTERALIIQESVAASAAQMGDPNSKTSRAMSRNFNVPRNR
jgi:uncharacterized damage-inducible protein DinB